MVSSILQKIQSKAQKKMTHVIVQTMIHQVECFPFGFWESRGHRKLFSRFTDLYLWNELKNEAFDTTSRMHFHAFVKHISSFRWKKKKEKKC